MAEGPSGARTRGAGNAGAITRRALLSGVGALGLEAAVAACSSSPHPVTRTTPVGTPTPGGSSTASRSVADAQALRAVFAQTAKQTTTPGAVMLYRTPGGTLSDTYGAATTSGSPPITLADHFRIGSLTKTLTGTVILQLGQEGKLRLEDPVARYHPAVPNGAAITIGQLLDMRSGLYNYSEALSFNQTLDSDPGKVWTPEELLAIGFAHPPYFAPGKGYHYTNTGTILLGLIIEKLDGRPLATSYQKRLFGPVGMHQTVFPPASSAAIPTPHPQGYMYGTNVSTIDSAVLPAAQQSAAAAGTLKPNDVTNNNPSWTWAAGQAISTAADLTRWVTALGDGSLLNPIWQKKRLDSLQPVDASKPDGPLYGLGIAKFGPMYGHTGELPGFQTFAGYDPATKRSLVVIANLNSAPDGRAVSSAIAIDLIKRIYQ